LGRFEEPAPSAEEESRPAYAGWRVVAASGVGVFFASLVVVTFPVFLKPWAEEFSWSRQAVSAAFGIAAVVAGVCAGPLGYVLDRLGARRIVVPSLLLLGSLFASLALLTPRLGHLYLMFAALGIAGIGTSPVAYARATSTWFTARRGLSLALMITGGALGGVLHPPIADALIRRFGWRAACATLGVLALAIGVPMVQRFVRERPSDSAGAAALEGESPGRALRSPRFWALAAVLFCGTLAQNSVIVHLPALLTDRGVPSAPAAAELSVMALAAMAGRLVTGVLIDRTFAARVLVALMALAAAGAFLLSGARSFGASVFAATLVGFGTGGESDVVPYLLSRYFGLKSFSSIYGVAWLANALGGALGPIAMGRAYDASGTYGPILTAIAVVALGAAGLALALPRYAVSAARP
jgi:predicted MFS family arabinose efflux permease